MKRETWQAAKSPALALLGLLTLLAANLALAFAPVGAARLPVKLALCAAMTLILMVFCMHLRRAQALLRLVAAIGFVWIAILIGLALTDFLARAPVPPPWR